MNGNFAPPYRARQIRELLSAREGLARAKKCSRVQKDVYSGFGHFLARQVVAAYEKRNAHNPGLDAAVALLRGVERADGQGPGRAVSDRRCVPARSARAMAENALAPAKGVAYEFHLAPGGRGESAAASGPRAGSRDYDEMLLRALVDAVEEGRRMQGRDPGQWQYGEYLRVTITHPVIHEMPLVGRYFDIGPVPMSGVHHHREADQPHAGALHADERGPRRLGPLAAEYPDRPIRPDPVEPLSGSVDGLLQRPQLSRCSSARWTPQARWYSSSAGALQRHTGN